MLGGSRGLLLRLPACRQAARAIQSAALPTAADQPREQRRDWRDRSGGRGGGRGGGVDWRSASRGPSGGSRRPPSPGDGSGRDPDVDFALRIPEATDPAASAALTAAAAAAGIPTAFLRRGRARLFREVAPIVYAGSVDRLEGEQTVSKSSLHPGSAVAVADAGGAVFGWGWWNGASAFRIRVAALAGEAATVPFDTPALIAARIASAAASRAALGLGGAGSSTDVYRLINSEGDRLSGLVVDRLGGVLVVSASAAWVVFHRPAVEAACRAAVPEATALIWTTAMLREEGIDGAGSDSDDSDEEGEAPGAVPPAPTIVTEHGLRFTTTPGVGQKTGFYADQRESRALVAGGGLVAPGDKVLDVCTFSGGFAIAAARAGAARVVGVDSSAPALTAAAANAALNGVAGVTEWVKSDALAFMKGVVAAGGDQKLFNLVVLDPPKFAPTKASLGPALRKYRTLNAAAMRCVTDGGLLMTCSCSGAVAQAPGGGVFLPMLRAAAADAGVRLAVLRVAGAGPDHPVDPAHQEGAYLTNVLVRVERAGRV